MAHEDDDAPALPAPWGSHPLPPGADRTLTLGPLELGIRRRPREIWLSHRPGAGTRGTTWTDPRSPSGEEDAWTRWPVDDGIGELALTPTFPDRPVVVEPEHPFRLLPGTRARIFVRVPLWVRVLAPAGGATLTEVPSVLLSDTWWGTFTEGELCYWLQTTARREVEPEVFAPHLAVCPLQLVNRSDDELPVERIALRVTHLTLFGDRGRLWSDETRVRYRGTDEGSRVEVGGTRPEEAPEAVRVAEPREEPPSRGLSVRSFARIRALSGLAGL